MKGVHSDNEFWIISLGAYSFDEVPYGEYRKKKRWLAKVKSCKPKGLISQEGNVSDRHQPQRNCVHRGAYIPSKEDSRYSTAAKTTMQEPRSILRNTAIFQEKQEIQIFT